jgi:hypothetical protein
VKTPGDRKLYQAEVGGGMYFARAFSAAEARKMIAALCPFSMRGVKVERAKVR